MDVFGTAGSPLERCASNIAGKGGVQGGMKVVWERQCDCNRQDPSGKLRTFWTSYFVAPWACWTVSDNMHIPCLIPSNQMVEAFFRNVVRYLGGRGQLRRPARAVVQKMLPEVMNGEDMNFPDKLLFEVTSNSFRLA